MKHGDDIEAIARLSSVRGEELFSESGVRRPKVAAVTTPNRHAEGCMLNSLHVRIDIDGRPPTQQTLEVAQRRTVRIGRLLKAQIHIDHSSVARLHAIIDCSTAGATLTSMASVAGVLLNGRPVRRARLSHGDTLLLGEARLSIGLGRPAGDALPTPPPDNPAEPPVLQMTTAIATNHASPTPAGTPERDPAPRRSALVAPDTVALRNRPSAALPPEPQVTNAHRVLEMRVYWREALLAVHHYDRPKKITIGEAKGTDFFISSEGLPLAEFPLVRTINDDYVLTYTSSMAGELEVDGQSTALDNLRSCSVAHSDGTLVDATQVRLPANSRTIVHWGGATFALRFVAPPAPPARALLASLDLPYVNVLLASCFLHVIVVAVMLFHPYDPVQSTTDLYAEPLAHLQLPERPSERIVELAQNFVTPFAADFSRGTAEPTRSTLEADPRQRHSRPTDRPLTKWSEGFARMFDRSRSRRKHDPGSLSLFSIHSLETSSGRPGEGGGFRGGLSNEHPRPASRSIAGPQTTSGGRLPVSRLKRIPKRDDRPLEQISVPGAQVGEAMPRSVIQGVIDRHRQQIRYCYEQQLQSQQLLQGRVVVSWVIAATGKVSRARIKQSTLDSPAVLACIVERVRTWRFPRPAGGGVVEVKYPFIFRAR